MLKRYNPNPRGVISLMKEIAGGGYVRFDDLSNEETPIMDQILELAEASPESEVSIARRAGVGGTCLSRYRTEKATPRMITAESLAGALGYRIVLVKKVEADARR